MRLYKYCNTLVFFIIIIKIRSLTSHTGSCVFFHELEAAFVYRLLVMTAENEFSKKINMFCIVYKLQCKGFDEDSVPLR